MSKYNAKSCEYNGLKFDSKIELERYKYLLMLENRDLIFGLQVHPKYILQDKFECYGDKYSKIEYEADFAYYDHNRQAVIVEDVKGMPTETAKLKRKLFINKWSLNNPDGILIYLEWIVPNPVWNGGGWTDYFELQKLRKERKKVKA
jgi:hypothetical protein